MSWEAFILVSFCEWVCFAMLSGKGLRTSEVHGLLETLRFKNGIDMGREVKQREKAATRTRVGLDWAPNGGRGFII